jgi:hypothetical protein
LLEEDAGVADADADGEGDADAVGEVLGLAEGDAAVVGDGDDTGVVSSFLLHAAIAKITVSAMIATINFFINTPPLWIKYTTITSLIVYNNKANNKVSFL